MAARRIVRAHGRTATARAVALAVAVVVVLFVTTGGDATRVVLGALWRGSVGSWYALGYELSTLHNIASRGATGTAHERNEVEAVWREALERFLTRAERAQIRYEDLARVIAWLENLVGPATERDFTNIARSLEELRRHAVNVDRLYRTA